MSSNFRSVAASRENAAKKKPLTTDFTDGTDGEKKFSTLFSSSVSSVKSVVKRLLAALSRDAATERKLEDMVRSRALAAAREGNQRFRPSAISRRNAGEVIVIPPGDFNFSRFIGLPLTTSVHSTR